MRKSFFLLAVLCGLLSVSQGFQTLVQAQEKQFTIDQVMSAPFASDLVAAPVAGRVAWVLNAKGARNIWVADPPGYKGRQITSYVEDDGMEIGELTWTPDGRSIVFTRGGDLEGFGENPNPHSQAEEPKQGIWMVSLDGRLRHLAEGHSATIAAKGGHLAFIFKRDVWSVRLDGSEKAALLFQTKGRSNSIHWSPDDAKISFISSRGDHNFVGVYDTATKGILYLDPSVDRDSEPIWSRDGKQVAFIRIPTSREAGAFAPKRAGRPWSIRVADVETGRAREVWRADEGRGSVFRNVVAHDQLLWSADNRIVFPWEKD
ncbi:MAG TPA: hypothetical protein VN920_00995, partial [Pyrinomonadaceae bacterium]|nr:hypothetical protein [Pyrinomonadaceae bacterium]